MRLSIDRTGAHAIPLVVVCSPGQVIPSKSHALVSAVTFATLGATSILITPSLMAALAAHTHMSDRLLGLVMSGEINAIGIMVLATAFFVSRVNRRHFMFAALVVMALGSTITAVASGAILVALAGIVFGCQEGIALGLSYSALAQSKDIDRAFGVYLVISAAVSLPAILYMPQFIAFFTARSVFLLLAGVSLATAFLLPWFHATGSTDLTEAPATVGRLDAFLALGGTFLYFLSNGAIWSFAERLGTRNGLTPGFIAFALPFATISGLGGAAALIMIPKSIGRAVPLALSGLISVAGLALIVGSFDGTSFLIAMSAVMFGWNFAQPLLSGLCT